MKHRELKRTPLQPSAHETGSTAFVTGSESEYQVHPQTPQAHRHSHLHLMILEQTPTGQAEIPVLGPSGTNGTRAFQEKVQPFVIDTQDSLNANSRLR